jgi:MFS family permease
VLREPYVARLLATSMVARLPQGMSGLAIILLLTPRLGYGRAGLATGVAVAGAGVSNVVLARAVDRVGARRVLIPVAIAYPVISGVLAADRNEPYTVVLVTCLVLGLVTPPITSVSRGVWPRLLDDAGAQTVYGLEATAQELIYIAGPAGVALIAGLANARVAVVVSGLTTLATFGFVTAPPLANQVAIAAGKRVGRVGRRVGRYAAVGTCLTFGLAMTEIATVDFVGGRGASASAGVVLAIWSAGSLVGGLLFGAAKARVTDRTMLGAVAITAGGLALASVAPNVVGLAVILCLSGAAVAPTMARIYSRIGAAAGEGSSTEAFGWLAVGFLVGASLGSAVGGSSVEAIGARWTFLLAGGAALSAVAVVGLWRPVAS